MRINKYPSFLPWSRVWKLIHSINLNDFCMSKWVSIDVYVLFIVKILFVCTVNEGGSSKKKKWFEVLKKYFSSRFGRIKTSLLTERRQTDRGKLEAFWPLIFVLKLVVTIWPSHRFRPPCLVDLASWGSGFSLAVNWDSLEVTINNFTSRGSNLQCFIYLWK